MATTQKSSVTIGLVSNAGRKQLNTELKRGLAEWNLKRHRDKWAAIDKILDAHNDPASKVDLAIQTIDEVVEILGPGTKRHHVSAARVKGCIKHINNRMPSTINLAHAEVDRLFQRWGR